MTPPPPSINPHEPLLSSYLYTSASSSNHSSSLEWMMGIDEAGRGPVLGPMVYAAAFCPISFTDQLNEMGFADSKTLTHQKREDLLDQIISRSGQIEWNVKVLTPSDISQGMSRKIPYNLNAQAFDATCQIIQSALDQHYNIQHIYVDTLGPPKVHQSNLEKVFPNIAFTVCSKADSIYPIVSAASCAAKVTRDAIVQHWIHPESIREHQLKTNSKVWDMDIGSGYPSDPNTVAWLNGNFDPIFGFPQLARFSWATVKTLLTDRGVNLKWNDEPATIQKWFAAPANSSACSTTISKQFGLQNVGTL